MDLAPELRNAIYMLAIPVGQEIDTNVRALPKKTLGINIVEVKDRSGVV